jgi:hypothetical protein
MSGKIKAASIRTGEAEGHEALMAIVNDANLSKSAKIRQLFAITQDRSTVANLLDIKYQHVRNVLLTVLTTKKDD